MTTIDEILSQRSDLSTFLVHLTKQTEEYSAKEVLTKILADRTIKARSPFGQAISQLKPTKIRTDSQRCVCFTETPLAHLKLLTGTIELRQVKLEPYGIALPKKLGRKGGANPVWYLDMTPGAPEWLPPAINEIIGQAIAKGDTKEFEEHPISKIAPFIEQMGTWEGRKKEFWWEREWRKRGDFSLPQRIIVIAPEAEHEEIKVTIEAHDYHKRTSLIDADWSLEQVIGRLAGFSTADLSL